MRDTREFTGEVISCVAFGFAVAALVIATVHFIGG